MKKIVIASMILCSVVLNAQVMPGINSKGGAMTVPKGKLKLGIKHIYFNRDNMYNGTHKVKNMQNLDANVNMTLIGLKYGVSDDFELRLMIPHKDVSANATLGANNIKIDNSGVGDIIAMAKYVVLPIRDYGFALAVGAGIKFPTGSTDSKFEKAPLIAPNENTPLPTQLGTGGYEYKIELGLSKLLSQTLRVDMHTMYTYRPKAEHNYDFGNELSYDLAITKAISKNINIGIEYNGKYNTKTDMGDDLNAPLRAMLPFKAFSGTVGYVTPQIEYLPFDKPKFHIGFGVSFLAHYNLKEYQPLEEKRFVARIGYMF